MIDLWLEQIANIISANAWFAPILALVAGILTSITPCSLSGIPLVISYVGGVEAKSSKRAFLYSLVFAAGTAVTFIVLGLLATTAGMMFGAFTKPWFIILGILMMLMALQVFEVINIIPSSNLISKNTRRGVIGAFLAGGLSGLFSSPCSTPVLVALLAVVAGKGNLLWGILLMLLYSIGHSVLVIIAGTSVGFVKKINASNSYKTLSSVLKICMGIIILLIGFYMFYLGF